MQAQAQYASASHVPPGAPAAPGQPHGMGMPVPHHHQPVWPPQQPQQPQQHQQPLPQTSMPATGSAGPMPPASYRQAGPQPHEAENLVQPRSRQAYPPQWAMMPEHHAPQQAHMVPRHPGQAGMMPPGAPMQPGQMPPQQMMPPGARPQMVRQNSGPMAHAVPRGHPQDMNGQHRAVMMQQQQQQQQQQHRQMAAQQSAAAHMQAAHLQQNNPQYFRHLVPSPVHPHQQPSSSQPAPPPPQASTSSPVRMPAPPASSQQPQQQRMSSNSGSASMPQTPVAVAGSPPQGHPAQHQHAPSMAHAQRNAELFRQQQIYQHAQNQAQAQRQVQQQQQQQQQMQMQPPPRSAGPRLNTHTQQPGSSSVMQPHGPMAPASAPPTGAVRAATPQSAPSSYAVPPGYQQPNGVAHPQHPMHHQRNSPATAGPSHHSSPHYNPQPASAMPAPASRPPSRMHALPHHSSAPPQSSQMTTTTPVMSHSPAPMSSSSVPPRPQQQAPPPQPQPPPQPRPRSTAPRLPLKRLMQSLDVFSELCSSKQTTMPDMVSYVQDFYTPDSTVTVVMEDKTSTSQSALNSNKPDCNERGSPRYTFKPIAFASLFTSMRESGMTECSLSLAKVNEFGNDAASQPSVSDRGQQPKSSSSSDNDDYTRHIESSRFTMLSNLVEDSGLQKHSTVYGRLRCRMFTPTPYEEPESTARATVPWRIDAIELSMDRQYISFDPQALSLLSSSSSETNTPPAAPPPENGNGSSSSWALDPKTAPLQQSDLAAAIAKPSFLERLTQWLELQRVSSAVAEVFMASGDEGVDPLDLLARFEPLDPSPFQGAQTQANGPGSSIARPQSAFELHSSNNRIPEGREPDEDGAVDGDQSHLSLAESQMLLQDQPARKRKYDALEPELFLHPPSPKRSTLTSSGSV